MCFNKIKLLYGFPYSVRQQRLAESRQALDENEFVKRLVGLGGDREASLMLWHKLSEAKFSHIFTPYPNDSIERTFGLCEEDRDDDIILDILNKLGIDRPDQEFVKNFGEIDTPLRIAQFVTVCRSRV